MIKNKRGQNLEPDKIYTITISDIYNNDIVNSILSKRNEFFYNETIFPLIELYIICKDRITISNKDTFFNIL